MRKILFLFLCVQTAVCYAGGGEYAVSNIPDTLLKNANVVKRMNIETYSSNGDDNAIYHVIVAYTILNEQGERWANYYAEYDKFSSVLSFEGTLFDGQGNEIKRLKKSDVKDESIVTENNLMDDDRVKWHNFFYKAYPYTVQYDVTIRYRENLFIPRWIPQESPTMSVQQSEIQVGIPAINKLHYKMFNYAGDPEMSSEKGVPVYTWKAKDIPAVIEEYAMPSWKSSTTCVMFAAEKFLMDDYHGSNASWKDFGLFVYALNKDRDKLPDLVKAKVHELTDELTDVSEKIRVLYEYMQTNTRYISVQLGIGGFQPFDAKFVGEKKYGDCKALSNFMYSLLKEAGIRSVYTLISANPDDNYLLTDFPCSQFNHAVLFVPRGKDTTWLECTSQIDPPGYIGWVGNRYALAIDENGGTLVRTPSYGINENIQGRHVTATINPDGNLEAQIRTTYQAKKQDELHYLINGLSKDKLMDYLKGEIELPSYDISKFDYQEKKGLIPCVTETLDLVANNYATVSGKRIFVSPNLISRSNVKIRNDNDRKYALVINNAFEELDTAEITILPGYEVESKPQDVNLETKFGKYTASIKVAGDKLVYSRLYEQFSGRFQPADYGDLVKFYDAIFKADRNKLVLIKN